MGKYCTTSCRSLHDVVCEPRDGLGVCAAESHPASNAANGLLSRYGNFCGAVSYASFFLRMAFTWPGLALPPVSFMT